MSIVINYIETEFKKADLFARVAKAGFVTASDRQIAKTIFISHIKNTCTLFEMELRQGLIRRFDATAIAGNPNLRFELCLGYAQMRGFRSNGIEPESLADNITLAAFIEADKTNPAILELGRNEYFLRELAVKDAQLSESLMAYASERSAEIISQRSETDSDDYYEDYAYRNSVTLRDYLVNTLKRQQVVPRHDIT